MHATPGRCAAHSSCACAAIYTPAPTSGNLFSEACDGDTTPEQVDLRCQGVAHDTCGCIAVTTISPTPYYGCILSGYVPDERLPLVTLPGVVEPGSDPGCQTDPKASVPAGAAPRPAVHLHSAGSPRRLAEPVAVLLLCPMVGSHTL